MARCEVRRVSEALVAATQPLAESEGDAKGGCWGYLQPWDSHASSASSRSHTISLMASVCVLLVRRSDLLTFVGTAVTCSAGCLARLEHKTISRAHAMLRASIKVCFISFGFCF